ncbi:hypothetical protein EDB87DRAFT_1823999, partial [Lactarius vividus]
MQSVQYMDGTGHGGGSRMVRCQLSRFWEKYALTNFKCLVLLFKESLMSAGHLKWLGRNYTNTAWHSRLGLIQGICLGFEYTVDYHPRPLILPQDIVIVSFNVGPVVARLRNANTRPTSELTEPRAVSDKTQQESRREQHLPQVSGLSSFVSRLWNIVGTHRRKLSKILGTPSVLLVSVAGISHDTYWGNSPLLPMTLQHGGGDFHPTVGQVDATVNIYNPVNTNSPNHQASTLSWSDEVYQTSVGDNAHQRPFMALSSLPDVFPGPQTRAEAPDSQFAVQVDSMADGAQRNTHFDSDTSQTGELVVTTTYYGGFPPRRRPDAERI